MKQIVQNMKNGEYAHAIARPHEIRLSNPKCLRHEYASTPANAKWKSITNVYA